MYINIGGQHTSSCFSVLFDLFTLSLTKKIELGKMNNTCANFFLVQTFV